MAEPDPNRVYGAPHTFCVDCNRVVWKVDVDSDGRCCFCTHIDLGKDPPDDENERVAAMHAAETKTRQGWTPRVEDKEK